MSSRGPLKYLIIMLEYSRDPLDLVARLDGPKSRLFEQLRCASWPFGRLSWASGCTVVYIPSLAVHWTQRALWRRLKITIFGAVFLFMASGATGLRRLMVRQRCTYDSVQLRLLRPQHTLRNMLMRDIERLKLQSIDSCFRYNLDACDVCMYRSLG